MVQWGMAPGQFVTSTSTPLMQQGYVLTMKQMFVPLVKLESAIRVVQRTMKKENDVESDVWQVARKKPHKIRIKVGGGCRWTL